MPGIVTDQGVVHYEVYGQGKPVILLHGWLGSWRLWQSTMEGLGRGHRVYALDFWGFGESGKRRDSYNINDFVSLVDQFISNMGIVKAPLVGHSMGGTVSLATALAYPDRISKVAVVGSPINGSSLAWALQLAANPSIAKLLFAQMPIFTWALKTAAPFMCNVPGFPELLTGDMNQTTLASFFNSISSLKDVDLTDRLNNLTIPVLGIYGMGDNIVSPKQANVLQEALPTAKVKTYQEAKHFVMLDSPSSFIETLKNFLTDV